MANITWHFDVISPFAWLSLPAIERLAEEYPVRLNPVVLGAILAHWGSVGPAELPPKRLHTYRQVQHLAGRMDLPLRFPPRHPFRSLEVQRLLTALGASDVAVRRAFAFVWQEGRDPSEPAAFAALAERLGTSDPAGLIAGTDAKARLRAATDGAIAAGVFGVPTLEIDGEIFWGLDALPLAEAFLADRGIFAREEMARLAALPIGVERNTRSG